MAGGGSGVSVQGTDQGDRETWPERWLPATTSEQDRSGRFDQSEVVARRVVAKADPSIISLCTWVLHVWIDGWLPRRAGRTGTLVALIGVSSRPGAVFGHALEYLEAVAHQTGLDFLPRERKLPEASSARSTVPRIAPVTDLTAGWFETQPSRGTGVRVGWRLIE